MPAARLDDLPPYEIIYIYIYIHSFVEYIYLFIYIEYR